jgi:uncharacterized protein YciI
VTRRASDRGESRAARGQRAAELESEAPVCGPDGHGRTGAARYNSAMPMFHVVLHRSGSGYDHALPLEEQPGWEAHAAFMDGLVDSGFIVLGGPLSDEYRVVHAVEAASEAEVRAAFARDPWSESHLRVDAVEPWTIRLDGRAS